MGDMMVSGHNILGAYESFAGSHKLNYQLTSKLLSDSTNYEFVAVDTLENRAFEKSFA
jgi:UDP-3-O-[3-hydroxymyristoyl] N-acetylglucosamine deacetylase